MILTNSSTISVKTPRRNWRIFVFTAIALLLALPCGFVLATQFAPPCRQAVHDTRLEQCECLGFELPRARTGGVQSLCLGRIEARRVDFLAWPWDLTRSDRLVIRKNGKVIWKTMDRKKIRQAGRLLMTLKQGWREGGATDGSLLSFRRYVPLRPGETRLSEEAQNFILDNNFISHDGLRRPLGRGESRALHALVPGEKP